MTSSSSPAILYLDDDDDQESNHYSQTNLAVPRASSSNEMNIPCKKRKLPAPNSHSNPLIVNWSKRQRNNQYQPPSSRNIIDSHTDLEPILLDPDEYIIEEPDHQSFCSFDWTIQPPSTSLSSTKIPPTSLQTGTPLSNASTVTRNRANKPVEKKLDSISVVEKSNSHDKSTQEKRKFTAAPTPQPTSSIVRAAVQRGRPLKNSRLPRTDFTAPSVATQPPQPSRPSSSSTTPSTNSSTSEIRRQALNGTGVFSAFHDTKYYRCNICKFKSVTSATLLQHLFTHMFFCEHCSFFTYSHYNLSQHLLEKHHLNINEDAQDPSNPNSGDLLYVTRCPDGTFALCMDSSLAPPTTKSSAIDQRLIVSTVSRDDRSGDKSTKKKLLLPKDKSTRKDNDIVTLAEKRDVSVKRTETKGKTNQSYVSMKHRRYYSLRKSPCLHALTLEYSICRESTIRHLSHTQEISLKRIIPTRTAATRLIDEIAHCLRTIVNQIVDDESDGLDFSSFASLSEHSSPMCSLPNRLLQPVVSANDLDGFTKSLKLKNRYDQETERHNLYEREHSLRQNHERCYVLSSPENYLNEQSIISSLHSSLTNGDSIFTQAKIDKLPKVLDNTHRYLKGNLLDAQPAPVNNSNQKVLTTTQTKSPSANLVPSRPIISKSAHPLPSLSVDRNNNSITSSKPKIPTSSATTFPSSIIVLD